MSGSPDTGWLAGDDRPAPAVLSGAEQRLCDLHGAETAVVLSGAGAATAYALAALTNPGGHVIVSAGLRGAAREHVEQEFRESGRTVDFVDCGDLDAVAALVDPRTQLILTASMTDPEMRPIPVNDLAALSHSTDLLLVVDNTALTPAQLRPLDLGATVVVEACTPYLDDQAGLGLSAVCGPARLLRRISAQVARTGGRPDPWSDRMLAQALRTLDLRMAAHHRHADEIAEFLRKQPAVATVHRAGFDEAPWAVETHTGFGGLLSFTTHVPVDVARTGGAITVPAWEQPGLDPHLVRVAAGHDDAAELIGRLRALLSPEDAA
ncbi:PLP-dependent transferase [Actinoplanes flavus]|uniref:PLP-dependent transferase n=1 Tax=Actinoplanes flavus TaxID=2820290 RepID=A0ABS3UN35_9ACTN|nr:PLP-dependent transferase [Actinoplanes flavus]MBO3740188.1 PLP-dependent transferase [Actinoplanes flavus]